jgi:hypothetical protein
MRAQVLFFLFVFLNMTVVSSAQGLSDSSGVIRRDTAINLVRDTGIVRANDPLGVARRDSLPVAVVASIGYDPNILWDSMRVLPPGSIVVRSVVRLAGESHETRGKEGLFYGLLGMVFLLALFRRFFPKYWSDLFRLFFRTTLRQRQLRDQLQLASLPSLLLNAFFFLTMSFYLSLFLSGRGWNPFSEYWTFWLLLVAALMVVYLVKWIGLQFAAWVFGQSELGEDYTFLVFTVNKVMGLMLLPLVVGLAFGEGWVWSVSLQLSWLLIGGLLLYRGYLTYRVIRRQAVVSPFHFFLYWLGFELAPLLVLYRFLHGFFGK